MTDREVMQQALEAIERYQVKRQDFDRFADEITALKAALEQPEQEPEAWDKPSANFNDWWNGDYDDSANPFEKDSAAYWAWAGWQAAQRLWVGLTDEEINAVYEQAEVLVHHSWVGNGTVGLMFPIMLYKMFEAKLKERNT
jgi:hypothetical protein